MYKQVFCCKVFDFLNLLIIGHKLDSLEESKIIFFSKSHVWKWVILEKFKFETYPSPNIHLNPFYTLYSFKILIYFNKMSNYDNDLLNVLKTTICIINICYKKKYA